MVKLLECRIDMVLGSSPTVDRNLLVCVCVNIILASFILILCVAHYTLFIEYHWLKLLHVILDMTFLLNFHVPID